MLSDNRDCYIASGIAPLIHGLREAYALCRGCGCADGVMMLSAILMVGVGDVSFKGDAGRG